MKTVNVSVFALALASLMPTLASAANVAPTCSYVLDQEDYAEKQDGVLTVNNKKLRCETIYIATDSITPCRSAKNKTKNFELSLEMDGGEGNFFVRQGIASDTPIICQGYATHR